MIAAADPHPNVTLFFQYGRLLAPWLEFSSAMSSLAHGNGNNGSSMTAGKNIVN
jgi:hypothetical protein